MVNGAAPQRAPGLAAGMAVLGLFCAYIAATGLSETFTGLTTAAPLVNVRAGAAAALPAAAMLLLLALLLWRTPSADSRREKRLFGVVLACMPLLALMPLGLTLFAGSRLAAREYRRCEGPMGSRGLLTRTYARGDAPCPTP